MGWELDSLAMGARLPADKLSKVCDKLLHLSRSRKVTLKELQSLRGLLIFCCQVVLPGRSYADLTKNVTKPNHRITLNKELAWFAGVVNFHRTIQWPKLTAGPTVVNNPYIRSVYWCIWIHRFWRTHWTYGTWPERISAFHITFKELFPIVLRLGVPSYVTNVLSYIPTTWQSSMFSTVKHLRTQILWY